jgi:hypothetical protein
MSCVYVKVLTAAPAEAASAVAPPNGIARRASRPMILTTSL